MFKGKEPPPELPGVKLVRELALEKAISQIGTKESPPHSNQVKYSDWYGMIGPWCAMFCTWSYELAADSINQDSPSFVKGQDYAYVPYIVTDARNNANGLRVVSDPSPGDLVCFDWEGDGVFDHVGIFEEWSGGRTFFAIEGNTATGNDSDGGEVMRRVRDAAQIPGLVFVRVAEPS
jgi:hypothetical protein